MATTASTAEDDSSVRVALRIRPLVAKEKSDGCQEIAHQVGSLPQVSIRDKSFQFDYVFGQRAAQDQLYTTSVRPLVDAFFEGYNATVLAYGQTGSGKTFTMGSANEAAQPTDELPAASAQSVGASKGVIPRAALDIFEKMRVAKSQRDGDGEPPSFELKYSFLELYNEDLVDLLNPRKRDDREPLRMREAPLGVELVGIIEERVCSLFSFSCRVLTLRGQIETAAELAACIAFGTLNRTTAATDMNATSSRSHAIITLFLRQRRTVLVPTGESSDGEESAEPRRRTEVLSSRFHFVDLAGSERLKRTNAVGERAKEGININMGLLALSQVISCLGDETKRGGHIPYRDSKLTRLLQSSLGGNNKTLMIACASPADSNFLETMSTLQYANRARNIKNKAVVNQDIESLELDDLRREVRELRRQLRRKSGGAGSDMEAAAERQRLAFSVSQLQEQLKCATAEIAHLKALSVGLTGNRDEAVAGLLEDQLSQISTLQFQLAEARSRQAVALPPGLPDSSVQPATLSDDELSEAEEEEEEDADDSQLDQSFGVDDDGESDRSSGDQSAGASPLSSVSQDGEDSVTRRLAALQAAITDKQELMAELEAREHQLNELRATFDARISELLQEKVHLLRARDDAIARVKIAKGADRSQLEAAREKYERQIKALSEQIGALKVQAAEQARQMRAKSIQDGQLSQMRAVVEDLRRQRLDLLRKVREEQRSMRAAKQEIERELKVLHVRDVARSAQLRRLERTHEATREQLRRRLEETRVYARQNSDRRQAPSAPVSFSARRTADIDARMESKMNVIRTETGRAASARELERLLDDLVRRREEQLAGPAEASREQRVSGLTVQMAEIQEAIASSAPDMSSAYNNALAALNGLSLQESRKLLQLFVAEQVSLNVALRQAGRRGGITIEPVASADRTKPPRPPLAGAAAALPVVNVEPFPSTEADEKAADLALLTAPMTSRSRSSSFTDGVFSRLTSALPSPSSSAAAQFVSRAALSSKVGGPRRALEVAGTLSGHSHAVTSAVYIGDILVSGSRDTTVRIWDLSRGEPVATPLEHDGPVRALASRSTMLFALLDNGISVWDTTAPCRQLRTIPLAFHTKPSVLHVTPDERYLLAPTSTEPGVQVYDLRMLSPLRTLRGHYRDTPRGFAFLPGLLFTGARDRLVRAYDLQTFDLVETLQPPMHDHLLCMSAAGAF